MLNIQIDDCHKITSDNCRNVILQEKRIISGTAKGRKVNPDNIGKEVWDEIGYYPDLKSALSAYARRRIIAEKAESLEELYKLLSSIEQTIGKVSL